MTDAKRATVECWGCKGRVQWDLAHRVVALREKGHPEYKFCSACMAVITAAQHEVRVE